MLTPRLTNCPECTNIPNLLQEIDCKLAEYANGLFNNITFMLNQSVPAGIMIQLIAYKRILTYKNCNPDYLSDFCMDKIVSKVIRLTLGCNIKPIYTSTPTSTSSTTSTTTTVECPDCISGLPISIGTQEWTNCNLDVTTYRDGTPIPEVTDPTVWANLTTGAWCYYDNDSANGTTYGKLYNWYAVNDPRGLAPVGYHVPTDEEWTTLTTFLGGETVAGGKMKETGLCHWTSPNTDATNISGFTGLPGGYRNFNGTFSGIGYVGYWWSSSEDDTANAWGFYLNYSNGNGYRGSTTNTYGSSLRLIKD